MWEAETFKARAAPLTADQPDRWPARLETIVIDKLTRQTQELLVRSDG